MIASPHMERYFLDLQKQVTVAYKRAQKARSRGLDPEKIVSIPLAKNMAERVVGLISVVAPEITGSKVTARIQELEEEYGMLDWRVGFRIAEEVAKQEFFSLPDKQTAIEVGIRVGFAYLTLGIVSAPLEGFIGITIKKRLDGKEYLALKYAGPIRGAGGTAASTSVILADYVRVKMGYAVYDPQEKEISRYAAEIHDYHDRVTNLQYHPSDDELKFMVGHLPIEVDGDPTEKIEVSNYKDIVRIQTNLIRGGMALVVAEGLCQKAPKLWKRLGKWGDELGLAHWSFLKEFLALKEKIHAHGKEDVDDSVKQVKPNNTFIMDLVAGRPILTHPMGVGGFRLRYGRTRTSGFSAAAMNPATMVVLDNFVAVGTQLKVERPGKAATITVCEFIDGPIVRLKSGSVSYLATREQALACVGEIEEILFLGDILFNYGDFSENGHYLAPAGYCAEWWTRELAKVASTPTDREAKLIANPFFSVPTWAESLALSAKHGVPLHPAYTYYWKLVGIPEFLLFLVWLKQGRLKTEGPVITKWVLPLLEISHKEAKKFLEHVGMPHEVVAKESVVLGSLAAKNLAWILGVTCQQDVVAYVLPDTVQACATVLDVVNLLAPAVIRDKAGTFVGARMGRPEKAKTRSLTGSPQVMFPVGEEGDRLRSFQSALKAGKVRSAFPLRWCEPCASMTVYVYCERCKQETVQKYHCRFCGDIAQPECRHGPGNTYKIQDLDIAHFFTSAKALIGEKLHPDLIKGIRGSSNKHHIVEHLAKGILRAKNNIYVNKDGTTRYDCTELPLTHFKPKEIHTSVERLLELGYFEDYEGVALTHDDQILELRPQDIILPGFDSIEESGPQVLFRVAQFVDELLVKFYKLKPFYNLKKSEDLVGHLVIGLAPHISAGTVGRIIGYTNTQGLFAHPMYHAGLRRDCDGDEAAVMLLMDAFLNFSRSYLPNTRGSTMDSPLVLTSFLDPAEVDDQVHGMDIVRQYPLALYEAALALKNPWDVKIEQLGSRLGTVGQFEGFGYTHPVANLNKGVMCSAYKTLPSMVEKLVGQMEIAKNVRAVDMGDVARLVIQKHFLKDIKGNLRKFSMQKFRCVKCNTKYRRPPLSHYCTVCQNRLIFTISHGSVIKYLGPSQLLAQKYEFSPYLKQTLNIVQSHVDSVFGREKDKQVGLADFFG